MEVMNDIKPREPSKAEQISCPEDIDVLIASFRGSIMALAPQFALEIGNRFDAGVRAAYRLGFVSGECAQLRNWRDTLLPKAGT